MADGAEPEQDANLDFLDDDAAVGAVAPPSPDGDPPSGLPAGSSDGLAGLPVFTPPPEVVPPGAGGAAQPAGAGDDAAALAAARDEDDEDEEAPPKPQPSFAELMGLGPDREDKQWRRLPGMTVTAVRLVWGAAGWRVAVVVALQVLQGAGVGAQLLTGNRVLSQAIAAQGRGGSLGDIGRPLGALLAVTLVSGLLGNVVTALQKVISELVGNHTYEEIISTATSVELAAFEAPAFHDRLQRAATAAQMRPTMIVQSLVSLASAVIGILGITVALVTIEPLFLPFVALGALPSMWATVRNAKTGYLRVWGNTGPERERSYVRQLLTGKDSAKEVRVFNLTRFLRLRNSALNDEILSKNRAEAWKQLRVSTLGGLFSAVATAAVFGFLLWLFLSSRVDAAAAVTAAVGVQQLQSRLSGIAFGASGLYEGALYLDDFASFVALREAVPPRSGAAVAPFRRLAVEHVDFTYPGTSKQVLRDVSVEIGAGEIVALVGENGSGKTTLAKLLCSLYQPSGGRVLWDGADVSTLDPESVRSNIAVIFQDFVQYHLRARDNIAMGRHERFDDLDAVVAAASHAGADRFLAKLPEGWDTRLGRQFDGGQDLSVGQWQRVALARAFFRDAPFIVLDEPTAALDARAEHQLFQRIRSLTAGRSVLLISHRFSSVREADRIYVLEKGRVTEGGSHEELMDRGGTYAELFTLQASAYL